MPYATLDKEFKRKFQNALARQGRHTTKYRKNRQCGKETFIRRTLNKWLKGKFFKVIFNTKYQLSIYDEEEIVQELKYILILRVQYDLGWNDGVDIFFQSASDPPILKRNFPIHEFLNLKFQEITLDEYNEVAKLFAVDKEVEK